MLNMDTIYKIIITIQFANFIYISNTKHNFIKSNFIEQIQILVLITNSSESKSGGERRENILILIPLLEKPFHDEKFTFSRRNDQNQNCFFKAQDQMEVSLPASTAEICQKASFLRNISEMLRLNSNSFFSRFR